MIKTAFIAVFAVSIPHPPATATELNSLRAADVRAMTSGLVLRVPTPVVADRDEPGCTLDLDDRDAGPDARTEAAPRARPAAPGPAIQEAVTPKNGLDPVVITVSGLKFGEIGPGPFELRNALRFMKFIFQGRRVTEDDLANGLVSFNPRYFFPDEDEDAAHSARDLSRLEDNYLEQKLREIPGYEQHNVVIVPFSWSRDPGDTRLTLPLLQERIIQVYDEYKGTGRPIYILAHSWGSVMSHTALHRVARVRPDVRIDKLITAGSPLVPSNLVVRIFVKIEKIGEGLEQAVSKPANVAVWRNIWARRDAYSNNIPAADSNYQADAEVENLEPTLIQLILHNKLLKKEARKDLFKIRDIKAWHGAYFFDYKAELKSLQKEIFVPVFHPVLAPQVVSCAKAPAMCAD